VNEFTASNGIKITTNEGGGLEFACSGDGPNHSIAPAERAALRDLFRAEEDERLGRWRWPEDPDYVIYEDGRGHFRIVRESDGSCNVFGRWWYETHKSGRLATSVPTLLRAAGAYFDAHPEPKPWDAAKDNEIWVLTGVGGLELPWRRTADGEWESVTPKAIRRRNNDLITAGRCIWPEEQS
jgi:hypothetical protein